MLRKTMRFYAKTRFSFFFFSQNVQLPTQDFFIPKIYMLDYIKKYMGPFRFLEPRKKYPQTCTFLKIFNFWGVITQNHLFLENFFWHLFAHFLQYFGIKVLLIHTWKSALKSLPKYRDFLRKGFWSMNFCPIFGENIKIRFFAKNKLTLWQFK